MKHLVVAELLADAMKVVPIAVHEGARVPVQQGTDDGAGGGSRFVSTMPLPELHIAV